MKSITYSFSLSFILITSFTTHAQSNWQQIPPPPTLPQNIQDFPNVENGTVTFADVDGDNDEDLFITGTNFSNDIISELHINDGNGSFHKSNGFPINNGVENGAVAFSDVDGDNDLDLLITGSRFSSFIANLFLNNGQGVFSLVSGTPFQGVKNSSVAFADIDGDNDQDVIITGEASNSNGSSSVYINDSIGNFTLLSNPSLQGVIHSAIDIADVDGDNDQDLLITGENNSGQNVSQLYTNSGTGLFNLVSNTPFTGVVNGAIAFEDIDGDNDQDLLITGDTAALNSLTIRKPISRLYTNNGTGSFSFSSNLSLKVQSGAVAFADTDGDNDKDLLIVGSTQLTGGGAFLYTNNGSGNFTRVMSAFIGAGTHNSAICFADVDGDSDQDVIIQGNKVATHSGALNGIRSTALYINYGANNFKEARSTGFNGMNDSSIKFADVDGDNDQDAFVTGLSESNLFSGQLYLNDGSGGFSLVSGTPFGPFGLMEIAFGDIDGDNDQDLLLTGGTESPFPVTHLYLNNGLGVFNLTTSPFAQVNYSTTAFADVDGDNDLDALIGGATGTGFNRKDTTMLYLNNGSGGFSLVSGTPFIAMGSGDSFEFADVDGDNDLDLLIAGAVGFTPYSAKLYTNNGTGTFTLVPNTSFQPQYATDIRFADVDKDNDLDVLITSFSNSLSGGGTRLYSNNGSGVFTYLNNPFSGISGRYTMCEFSDVDGDNDPDLILAGNLNFDSPSKLYVNDGSGNYSLVPNTPFQGVHVAGGLAFADVDNDGDEDFFITGSQSSHTDNECITIGYFNNNCFSNLIINNSPTLSAVASGASYQWLDCNNNYGVISGASSQKYIPNNNGSYAVEVTQNNCVDTSSCESVLNVGLDKYDFDKHIKITPNPTNGDINIDLKDRENSGVNVVISNSLGQVIFRKTYSPTKSIQLHLNGVSGLYIFEISTKNKYYRKKIIKR